MQILSRRTKNNPVLLGEPGRRQDRRGRGPGRADQQRRGPGAAEEQTDLHARPGRPGRRLEVPRRVRGAPQEGDERDHPARRHHPFHRRAPQPGRRRRRRGRDRRRLDPEAGPGPRRAADDRRDHARRVPQVPRARLGAGAPLRPDPGRPALPGGHGPHPRGPARALRTAPQSDDQRRSAGRGRRARRPLHLRPLPARQGDRPDRRGGLADAHQVDVDAAGLPRSRGGNRDDAAREGGGDRGPGVRKSRQPARHRAPADDQKAPARRRVGRGRERRAPGRRRRGDRRHRLDVDRHPGLQTDRGRDQKTDPHGGGTPQARDRPGGRDHRRLESDPPLPRRDQGPEAPGRLVHLPRPLRGRQDRARPHPRRLPVRRRGGDDPDRHVRVHGEARRQPSGRLASRATSATTRAVS